MGEGCWLFVRRRREEKRGRKGWKFFSFLFLHHHTLPFPSLFYPFGWGREKKESLVDGSQEEEEERGKGIGENRKGKKWVLALPLPPPHFSFFFLGGGHVWKSFLGFSASEIINDLGIPISPIIIIRDFFQFLTPHVPQWKPLVVSKAVVVPLLPEGDLHRVFLQKREKNKYILFPGKSCISESAKGKNLGGREIAVRRPRGAISSSLTWRDWCTFLGFFRGGQKCTHTLPCHKSKKKSKSCFSSFFTILTSSILAKLLMYRLTTMMVAASVPFRPEGRMRLS